MALRTSAARPSPKNSLGMPIRKPFTLCVSLAEKFSVAASKDVESRSKSGPHIALSNSAQSSALRAIGPAWSKLDA